MPRRYGADGTRLWNGKTPEEFTEADAYRFMAETEAVLQRKELMDDPAQPAPASGKEEFYLSKKDDVLLTPEQIAAEERRWLFDAPIAELAEVKGISIAVLLTGNPVNAMGNGIHGGNGVSIVINSKFIRCVPPFSLLVWINNGGSQSQPPGSSACTHAGISGIIRCK